MGGSTIDTSKEPWGPARNHLGNQMQHAANIWNSEGQTTKTWPGALQAGLDPSLQQGLSMMGTAANNAAGTAAQPYNAALGGTTSTNPMLNGIASGANGINTGSGFASLFNNQGVGYNSAAENALRSIFGAGGGISTGGLYQNLLNSNGIGNNAAAEGIFGEVARNTNPSAADQYLGGMAQGGNTINPFVQQIADSNADRIKNRVGSAMSGAGRYGSFAHGDALAKSISEANNPMFAQAYESDRNRQLAATGQIDAARIGYGNQRMQGAQGMLGARQNDLQGALASLQGLTGTQAQNVQNQMGAATGWAGVRNQDLQGAMGALQGMTGVQNQNLQNQMGASGAGTQQQQSWASLLSQLSGLQYQPAQQMMGAGGMLTDRADQGLAAQRALFEQQQRAPWDALAKYQGAVTGLSPLLAGMGATNQATNPGLLDWLKGGTQSGVAGVGAVGMGLSGLLGG
jgi:hypothetical protein